jgi:hypothetical protein
MTDPGYKVMIERVVLHGAALSPAQAERLRVSLEAALARRLADGSVAAATAGERQRVVAPAVRATASPEGLAGALAGSLTRVIGGRR